VETGKEVTATERILRQGKALVRGIEALESIEASGPIERTMAALLLQAYRRRLRAIVASAPTWVSEEILSADRPAGGLTLCCLTSRTILTACEKHASSVETQMDYRASKFSILARTYRPVRWRDAGGEIANMVAFLASEKASLVTGQAINADGGMVKAWV
jgi:NAD(P)-dependent dehydrogenase (short-subunit alcohol dehydrogenase family)